MNKKELALIEREKEIKVLSTKVIEKAQTRKGGSAALVPSSDGQRMYQVDLDENYCTVRCQCAGGHNDCKHKKAVRLHFASKIRALRNSELNPVYQFYRAGVLVVARLSQFSRNEKSALREQQRAEQRAAYVASFDPNGINAIGA